MRISDWSSDVCSSDLLRRDLATEIPAQLIGIGRALDPWQPPKRLEQDGGIRHPKPRGRGRLVELHAIGAFGEGDELLVAHRAAGNVGTLRVAIAPGLRCTPRRALAWRNMRGWYGDVRCNGGLVPASLPALTR